MKLFNIMLIPCNSTSDFYLKFKKRMMLHTILETVKLVFIVAIAVFFLLEYISPFAQTSLPAGRQGVRGSSEVHLTA